MDAPAEVGDLDLAVDAHEDVLGLDVPVDDVLAVQVAQGAGHLGDVLRGLPLGEAVLAAQVLVQLALGGELEDQEDALAVVEVPEELQDVGVPQVALDLDLAPHLLLHPPLRQLRLVEHLERADEAARALPRQVHAPELALAERPADLEHAEVELLEGRLLDQRGGFPLRVGDVVGRASCRGWEGLPYGRGRLCGLPLGGLGRESDGGGDGVGALCLQRNLVEIWPPRTVCYLRCGRNHLLFGSYLVWFLITLATRVRSLLLLTLLFWNSFSSFTVICSKRASSVRAAIVDCRVSLWER